MILLYLQANKISERCSKAQDGNSSHNRYVPERVFIELETRGFWKQHRANQSPLSGVEAGPHYDRQSDSLVVLIILWASCSNYLCAREEEVFRDI